MTCKWCNSVRTLFLKAEGFMSDVSVFTASHYPVIVCLDCGKLTVGGDNEKPNLREDKQ